MAFANLLIKTNREKLVVVRHVCECMLCLEAHPFTLATGNERQLKSRARSMTHRDRHTRTVSLSSLWPRFSFPSSLPVCLKYSDAYQVCLVRQRGFTYFHIIHNLHPTFGQLSIFSSEIADVCACVCGTASQR